MGRNDAISDGKDTAAIQQLFNDLLLCFCSRGLRGASHIGVRMPVTKVCVYQAHRCAYTSHIGVRMPVT